MKHEPFNFKPEDLHNWYLEATKELNPDSYNPNAQKPFSELTEEQKFIDKFICNKIKQRFKSAVDGLLEEIDEEISATQKEIELYDESIIYHIKYLQGEVSGLYEAEFKIKKWFPDVFKEADK